MKWSSIHPDFNYNKPIDFCGDWLYTFISLFNKKQRKKTKADFDNFTANKSLIAKLVIIICTTLVVLFIVAFSIITMFLYYITLPVRVVADILCELYAKISDWYMG